jgi:hypothetical protein
MNNSRAHLLGFSVALAVILGFLLHQRKNSWTETILERERLLLATRDELTELKNHLDQTKQSILLEEHRKQAADLQSRQWNQELAATAPETLWEIPPERWSLWQPESPYLWLSKDTLRYLQVTAFSQDGSLTAELATILTLSPEQHQTLNAGLRAFSAAYRKSEVGRVRYSKNHLSREVGDATTIEIPALSLEDRHTLSTRFDDLLASALGAQRTELVKNLGAEWISRELGNFGSDPMVITVTRQENKMYTLVIQRGQSWTSMGGPISLTDHLPAHLAPFFRELEWLPEAEASALVSQDIAVPQ